MKLYKNSDNDVFAFEEDGSQDHLISKGLTKLTKSQEDAHLNPPKTTQEKILDFEKSITGRRFREAVLGLDDGWLANVNAQIEALREQL